jgi:hypothetical protein
MAPHFDTQNTRFTVPRGLLLHHGLWIKYTATFRSTALILNRFYYHDYCSLVLNALVSRTLSPAVIRTALLPTLDHILLLPFTVNLATVAFAHVAFPVPAASHDWRSVFC